MKALRMMKTLIVVLCGGYLPLNEVAHAMGDFEDPSRPQIENLKRQGPLFSVQFSPGKPWKIYVVGREEAQFDFSKLELKVRRLTPYPSHDLLLVRKNGYYVVDTAASEIENSEVEVTTLHQGQKDTFRLNLKPGSLEQPSVQSKKQNPLGKTKGK